MKVALAYGRSHVELQLPDKRVTVIEPKATPTLPDEHGAFLEALRNPCSAPPLKEWVRPEAQVCIVFTDSTRATPNHRILPWLIKHLEEAGARKISLLNATGTHRPNTERELSEMLGPDIVKRFPVINHECEAHATLVEVGSLRGKPVALNRQFVEADLRIVTGFIEPHFFAGFSGGPKGIMPGIAGLQTVLANHSPTNLANPLATFAVTEGNPIWEEMRDMALLAGPSFLINVALNESRGITGVFAGDLIKAHALGVAFVKRTSMCPVPRPFDLVLTSNSGYPLDQNLYQGVKGMAAAARIVKPGGDIILACECSQGIPYGSLYEKTLNSADSLESLTRLLQGRNPAQSEDWQVQIQVNVQQRARVWLLSGLPEAKVRRTHLSPIDNLAEMVSQCLDRHGPDATVAVLPQGPLTIPYVDAAVS